MVSAPFSRVTRIVRSVPGNTADAIYVDTICAVRQPLASTDQAGFLVVQPDRHAHGSVLPRSPSPCCSCCNSSSARSAPTASASSCYTNRICFPPSRALSNVLAPQLPQKSSLPFPSSPSTHSGQSIFYSQSVSAHPNICGRSEPFDP